MALNGEVLTTPASVRPTLTASPSTATGVAGRADAPVPLPQARRALITAKRDPEGRATIYESLPQGLPRLMSVGPAGFHHRGPAAADQRRRVEAPAGAPANGRGRELSRPGASAVTRDAARKHLRKGSPSTASATGDQRQPRRRTGRNCWIEMSLTEGKNREVRRVLDISGCRSPTDPHGLWPVHSGRIAAGRGDEVEAEELGAFPQDAAMRIIAGQWRGRPIEAPSGLATRPTADRVRETLFSMLASRLGTFEGLRVADLFAGSGALGWKPSLAARRAPHSSKAIPTRPSHSQA